MAYLRLSSAQNENRLELKVIDAIENRQTFSVWKLFADISVDVSQSEIFNSQNWLDMSTKVKNFQIFEVREIFKNIQNVVMTFINLKMSQRIFKILNKLSEVT